ncbi:MAG: helix-turn-helix domain-containing protein [Desulfurococcales archaeon]|nr:helix-turn-helix domain-containing protein [Desulfurococcales archaeon]
MEDRCQGVSLIGPKTRRRIIEQLSLSLSYRQLASSLGVTPSAIHKYLTGRSTPRDEIMCRAIDLAGDLGLAEIGEIIMEDLAKELEALLEKLVKSDLVAPSHVIGLSDVVGRVKLAMVAGMRARPAWLRGSR